MIESKVFDSSKFVDELFIDPVIQLSLFAFVF